MAPRTKRSSFMVFVNHWRKDHPNMDVVEAVSHCSPIWENMTAQERLTFGGICASGKETLDQMDRVMREKSDQEENMQRTIERMVMEGKKSQDLENTKFLFCAFVHFVRDPDGDFYVPAEFGACEYSLKEGIISVFSSLIDPGHLSLGLGRTAQDHSRATHKLPLPPMALGESNMSKLYSQINRYICKFQDRMPAIVFTTTAMRRIVESCFDYLASGAKEDFLPKIVVYDIQYLFMTLKKATLDIAGQLNDKINLIITDGFFLRDFFEFASHIGCEFHEEKDCANYCAQSMVIRWAFTFSDYMCRDLGIFIEPGKHVPSKLKTNYKTHTPDTRSAALVGETLLDSFQSLATFQDLEINQANKSRRQRLDVSTIASQCSNATNEKELENIENKHGEHRYEESSGATSPISSQFSSSCGPYVPKGLRGRSGVRKSSRQRRHCRDLERRSQYDFPRSSEPIPNGATDQKDLKEIEKFDYQGEHSAPNELPDTSDFGEDEQFDSEGGRRHKEFSEPSLPLSPINHHRSREESQKGVLKENNYQRQVDLERRSPEKFFDYITSIVPDGPMDKRASSPKAKAYPYQDGPSTDSQFRSSEEFSYKFPPHTSRRPSKTIQHGATTQKEFSKAENYIHHHPDQLVDSQRHSPVLFWDEITTLDGRRSNAVGTYSCPMAKKYHRQGGHHRNSFLDTQHDSSDEFSDDISALNTGPSSDRATDPKGFSRAKEYSRHSGCNRYPSNSKQLD
ncbi:protein maelstrom homolog [Drosophila serrata]|uniref:protein maelstrom homolog n=1 Tax=Drosophila serrata TaxID=7274 RepID=UPI000A1D065F|nr:protein maelstrom homolog [Drosophila serrata]XP_020802615.1 protein maelstrom homolog [Drosophila serrata]